MKRKISRIETNLGFMLEVKRGFGLRFIPCTINLLLTYVKRNSIINTEALVVSCCMIAHLMKLLDCIL